MDDDVLVVPTPPGPPICCDEPMVSIAKGRAAGFDIEIWRCISCEGHDSTMIRTDGQKFWVGAMGRAIRKEQLRLIAESYGGAAAHDPWL